MNLRNHPIIEINGIESVMLVRGEFRFAVTRTVWQNVQSNLWFGVFVLCPEIDHKGKRCYVTSCCLFAPNRM